MKNDTKRFTPFILSAFIVLVDQLSKLWVMNNIPVGTLYKRYFNDFLWIVHVRNTGAAFSLGDSLPDVLRILIFVVGCLALMIFLGYLIVSKKQTWVTQGQRWFVAGILGGGIGTMIDRIFRFNEGVVDFISVKFYGIFGMDRWPTFNVSDSSVVVFVILFLISEVVIEIRTNKAGSRKK